MLRIEKLVVENIGPFEHQEFDFKDKVISGKTEIQLFTGQNGTGKTTILEMLTCLAQLNFNVVRRGRYKDERSNFTISLNNGEKSTYKVLQSGGISHGGILSNFMNKLQQYHNNYNYNDNNIEFDYAFFAYSGYRKINTYNIDSIKGITSSPFANALDFVNSINPNLLVEWIANQKTKEALASKRNDQEAAEKYTNAITRIEQAIEKIIGEKIEFRLLDNPLKVVINRGGADIDFDLLPDGLKSIISWISDLLMRLDRIKWVNNMDVLDRNFILFLDEIDVHLHPAWQRKILPIVQDLFKNAQIFVTTHSPFVIGSTDGVWIHKLIFDGVNTIAEEPTLSDTSKSYQLILDELFDIPEFFGIGAEEKLDEFRHLRNRLVHQQTITDEDRRSMKRLIDFFKEKKSIELDNIIGSELRQLSRLLNENFSYS